MKTNRHIRLSLALILLVFVFTFNSCIDTIQKPKIGDVFLVQIDTLSYTTWKVTKIKAKKLWYITNDYQVSSQQFIDSINFSENYTDLPNKISRKEFNSIQLKKLIPKSQ